jgi:hypothetical protein
LITWTELKKEVEAAVAKGLTLEQTKATVKMDAYDKGYVLFNWLHFNFNLPMPIKTLAITKRNNTNKHIIQTHKTINHENNKQHETHSINFLIRIANFSNALGHWYPATPPANLKTSMPRLMV